jgi:GntP family gluconate:H+ symporter
MRASPGAGSVFFCHVNDAGFWMVGEYLGLTLRQTIMAWSLLQTIVSLTGLAVTLLMWQVLA